MLTSKELRFLLNRLSWETVVPPSETFRYRIVAEGFGYSKDRETSAL